MKTAFAGILNNPASSLNSHSAGWNRLVRLLVDPEAVFVSEDCDWSKFDRIIINHGPNFKPGVENTTSTARFHPCLYRQETNSSLAIVIPYLSGRDLITLSSVETGKHCGAS